MVTNIENVSYITVRTFLSYLILAILKTTGTKTAYVIIETLKAEFGIKMSAGTLYNALAKLERAGYIERPKNSPNINITEKGVDFLGKVAVESKKITVKIQSFLERSAQANASSSSP